MTGAARGAQAGCGWGAGGTPPGARAAGLPLSHNKKKRIQQHVARLGLLFCATARRTAPHAAQPHPQRRPSPAWTPPPCPDRQWAFFPAPWRLLLLPARRLGRVFVQADHRSRGSGLRRNRKQFGPIVQSGAKDRPGAPMQGMRRPSGEAAPAGPSRISFILNCPRQHALLDALGRGPFGEAQRPGAGRRKQGPLTGRRPPSPLRQASVGVYFGRHGGGGRIVHVHKVGMRTQARRCCVGHPLKTRRECRRGAMAARAKGALGFHCQKHG
jgi:hypothetical protein